MPPRPLIFVIVVFWLAAAGWLFQRDLWPRLQPGEPPPYAIDLADEASEQKIYWNILKDGEDKGYAQTWVSFQPEDDTFELAGLFKLFSRGRVKQLEADLVVESSYRVTREGELRQLTINFSLPEIMVKGRIDGWVKDRQFTPHLFFNAPIFPKPIDRDLQAVPVSHRGNVLNPLQPLHRIAGLRPGQRWRQPLADPLEYIPNTLQGKAVEIKFLDAEVLPQLQTITRGKHAAEVCLVIEYQGDDIQTRIWVHENDGLVLRQETTRRGESLTYERQ